LRLAGVVAIGTTQNGRAPPAVPVRSDHRDRSLIVRVCQPTAQGGGGHDDSAMNSAPPHRRRLLTGVAVLVAALPTVLVGSPAGAVNAQHPTVVSADPANWSPHALDGTVYAVTQIGNRVYLGGSFTRVRNSTSSTQLNRARLVAFNATTGQIDTAFNPTVSGTVQSLVGSADGQSVYVGGSFSTVNGATRRRLARLDAATGANRAGFTPPNISATVNDMVLVGGRLILGGSFQTVDGASRRGLTAVNAATGAADSSININLAGPRTTSSGATAPVKVEQLDANPAGTRLVLIGNFSSAAGQARHQIAVVDIGVSPATLSPWATTRYQPECASGTPTYMRGVDISADGTWFAVVTAGFTFSGRLCDSATRWNLTTETAGKQPTWTNFTGGDSLLSVAITGAAVYVGGHQRWLDARDASGQGPGVSRPGIGAIDPNTGRALAWNPGKERGVGTGELYATPAGLWIGSDTSTTAGEFHGKIAFFPLP
jgi:hypothetical protein